MGPSGSLLGLRWRVIFANISTTGAGGGFSSSAFTAMLSAYCLFPSEILIRCVRSTTGGAGLVAGTSWGGFTSHQSSIFPTKGNSCGTLKAAR